MTDKETLMRQIQIHSFAAFETALFLDTHKTDREALAAHKMHSDHVKVLKEEYAKKYGPLRILDNNNDKVWEWVTTKWPWEYGSEV